MSTTKKRMSIYRIVLISMFIALMLLMNFTPIGYITLTGAFSITLMTIPVALGAVCTGELGGTILGFTFGLTSFLQAFGIGYMIDPSAAPLFNENPLGYTVMCFVPRIATGFVVSLVFSLFEKNGNIGLLAFSLSSALVPVLNTSLFTLFYVLFYQNTSFGGVVMTVILTILTINFLVELIVTLVAGTVISRTVYKQVKKI